MAGGRRERMPVDGTWPQVSDNFSEVEIKTCETCILLLLETHMLEIPTSRWTFAPPFTISLRVPFGISSRHCLLEINLSRNH